MIVSRACQYLLIVGFLISPAAILADSPKPLSVIDYMKSVKLDSSFDNRKELFADIRPDEAYKGTAEQNVLLIKHLLSKNEHAFVPFPSNNIEGCSDFYSSPEVTKYLTVAFKKNAISACIVTGTKTPQNTIRKKLQEEYRNATPTNGKTFTVEEHKAIHDKAYKAAGCKEDSADLWGWYVVDKKELPQPVIKLAIDMFGKCTITGD